MKQLTLSQRQFRLIREEELRSNVEGLSSNRLSSMIVVLY